MKKIILQTILSVCVAGLMILAGCGGGEDSVSESDKVSKTSGQIRDVKPNILKKGKKGANKKRKKLSKKQRKELRQKRMKARAEAIRRAFDTPPDDLSAEDKKIWRGLRKALDGENYREVSRYAEGARNSSSVELRSEAVSALSWFGSKGMASLTAFLSDADENVAQEAQTAWESGLMDIDDDVTKLAYLETAMSSIENEDMLDAISHNFNQVSDETAAVKSMMLIISKGGVGAEKAKEAYAFMTGSEWTNVSDASRWIAEKQAESEAGEEQ